jgi:hypothetical protein
MSKWKSIKDEVPEEGKRVLVYWPPHIKDARVKPSWRYVMGGSIGFNSIKIHNNGKWWWESIASFESHPPTHWMDCPDVPEEFEGMLERMEEMTDTSKKKNLNGGC